MAYSVKNTINIPFVTVALVKVRKHLRLQGILGRFRKPENKFHWLVASKNFQKKKEVRLFGVCVVKWRNTAT